VKFKFQPLAIFLRFVPEKSGLIKSRSSSEHLSAFKILWSHFDWCKFCIHLRSMKIGHFGIVEATWLKGMTSRSLLNLNILDRITPNWEPGSSVSIVSGYGLDDRAIVVRSRLRRKIFLLAPVLRPNLWSTHPPVQWVPGVLSSGVKRGRGVTLTTHPYLVPSSRMSRSYTSSPQEPPWLVVGLLCFFIFVI
jgi:hypothetical protein